MKILQEVYAKVGILTVVLTAALATNYLFAAWSSPPADPPNSNVDAPVNIGTTDQVKDAALSLNGLAVFGGALIQDGTQATGSVLMSQDGFGTAEWVATSSLGISGGGGGISQLDQGTGITLSPNPITDTGTISADTSSLQSRVSGSCLDNPSTGYRAIETIHSDGTVTCTTVPFRPTINRVTTHDPNNEQCTASCGASEFLVGGGCDADYRQPLQKNGPVAGEETWQCETTPNQEFGGYDEGLYCTAICME